ncbi:alpha/beta hydrolase [Asticcacaulis sp. EMRT-3]|uniref:alpha/beta hydrolase n=1 Tax=Asticcacaulis sp. EMRT-3 TaxID=3040349 RepID=UPI0024AF7FA3|nr:alpha/beta hydrolase [Asticcacaulis sp. EMRT-3]MDI7775159.1 alpha/beta hydrolase [Asticcacaulis sp. EMRT-3]
MDRRTLLWAPLSLAAVTTTAQAKTPMNNAANWPKPAFSLDLWPHPPVPPKPGLTEQVTDASTDPNLHHRRMRGIIKPRIAVFPAKSPNGGAMLIIPGGGFSWNAFDTEGYLLAQNLNRAGITCFVLFYRLANDGWANRPDIGTIDAQRALRLIRARAVDLKIDPKRLGVIGFSAGGFIAASLATRFAAPLYKAQDRVDAFDARPNLAALMYPVQSLDPAIAYSGAIPSLFGKSITPEQIARYSPDHHVSAATPPCFMAQAEDDTTVPIANTLSFRAALKAKGIKCETHLFATGGHGFGMTPAPDQPHRIWPELFVNFARQQGLLG